jgi:hypothetical protein
MTIQVEQSLPCLPVSLTVTPPAILNKQTLMHIVLLTYIYSSTNNLVTDVHRMTNED